MWLLCDVCAVCQCDISYLECVWFVPVFWMCIVCVVSVWNGCRKSVFVCFVCMICVGCVWLWYLCGVCGLCVACQQYTNGLCGFMCDIYKVYEL